MEKLTVSSAILEKMLKVSDRRIRQLVEEGILVRVTKGKYDLVTSIANYIQFLKLSNEVNKKEQDSAVDYDYEHGLNERIKRQQNEIKLQLMQGQVHKATQVEAVISDMLLSFRNKAIVMPEKLTPMLLNKKDMSFIKNILSREINEMLDELKEYKACDYQDDSFIDLYEVLEDDEILEE